MSLLCLLKGHDWNYCTCKRCKKYRGSDHHYKKINRCVKECTVCGKKVISHDWSSVTPCLTVCKQCGESEIHHKVGEKVDSDYDVSKDLYYDEYKCSRCGRKFRNYSAYGGVNIGEEVPLGTYCIVDPADIADLEALKRKK